MPAIDRISSAFSEPWTAWTMLLLILLLIVADRMQRGLIMNSFHGLFHLQERDSIFSDITPNIYGVVALRMYQIGIVAMALYSGLFTEGRFSFLTYLIIIALTLIVFLIVHYLTGLVNFVFLSKEQTEIAMHNFNGLLTCTTILLYPVVAIVLFTPELSEWILWTGYGIVVLFYVSFWLSKAFILFFNKLLVCIYILLYFCTLEIAPLAGMVFAVYMLIN